MADTTEGAGDAKTVPWAPDVPQAPKPQQSSTGKAPHASTGACDACRARKVRCLANESSMSSKCQRCTRAGRECVYTVHSKTRRRKRTDTRVKELEEKVKSLSMLLEQGRGDSRSASRRASRQTPDAEDDEMGDDDGEWSDDGDEETHQDGGTLESPPSKCFDGYAAFGSSNMGPTARDAPNAQPPKNLAEHLKSNETKWAPTGSISPDIIARGLITMDKAQELFDRYIEVLSPSYPGIWFPPGTSASVMRKERPILFLSVVAAGAGNQEPALNLALNQEILQVYANKVAVHGEKSLELVMSILISTLWYYPPDKFEELKFHQYIHMAATMALDIGLGKRPRVSRATEEMTHAPLIPELKKKDIGRDNMSFSPKTFPDSSSMEARRTLLACYLSCASVSMGLRLPNMLRFTSWMNDCLIVLETSPDAAPTDKRFAAWIRIQRLVEECVIAFSLDDPGSTVSLSDDHVQQMLKGYEKQLFDLKKSMKATPGLLNGFLEINFYVNNIYIHEIALHPEHDSEDFRPPFFVAATSPKANTVLGPAYVNAIAECMTSAQNVIKIFLGMDVETVRSLPALLYVRIVYCAIVLIKLDVSASSPDSEIGKILDRDSLLTRAYIEKALVQMKRVAGTENKNILAAKFCMILGKLVLWYRQIVQPGSSEQQKQSLSPAKAFSGPYKPDEIPSESVHSLGPEPSLPPPPDMAAAMAAPPMPNPASSFQSFSSFSGAPQYPTPIHSPFPSTSLAAPTTTAPGMPDLSTVYDHGKPKSAAEYSSPEFNVQSSPAFTMPMEVDPNMFNQLQDADPFTYNQDPNEWMFDGMDYSNMASVPDFDWDSIPGPQ